MPIPLPTKSHFRSDTAHTNILKMRGTIAAIDVALDEWHSRRNLQSTIRVYKECRHWLKAKLGKRTDNSLRRQVVIRAVAILAVRWINELDPNLGQALDRFEQKKANGANPNAKSLSGVYQHERSLYIASGKTYAPSGTILHGRYDGQKDFNQLTELEYQQLDRQLGQKYPVIYLTKLERLRKMVSAQNGLLYCYDGTLLHTSDTGFTGDWPYALDKYSNLFSTDDREEDGQFNHSSFNAGNDVICAGMIKSKQGVLESISNNSGHYKPTRAHLFNAAQIMLAEVGAGAEWAKAEWWDFSEAGWYNIYTFPLRTFKATGFRGAKHDRIPAH